MKSHRLLKLTCLTFYFLLSFLNSHAQLGKVWATIPIKQVPKLLNGQLVSTNSAFNKAINNLNIVSVERALPASRSLKLQRVYEISCNCNEVDLYTTLVNKVDVVSQVELAPNYQALDVPNDYPTFPSSYALDLINAPAAWDITHGDPNIYVAISDQNYQVTNVDLADEIVYYDASNNSSITHGTRMPFGFVRNTIRTASILITTASRCPSLSRWCNGSSVKKIPSMRNGLRAWEFSLADQTKSPRSTVSPVVFV